MAEETIEQTETERLMVACYQKRYNVTMVALIGGQKILGINPVPSNEVIAELQQRLGTCVVDCETRSVAFLHCERYDSTLRDSIDVELNGRTATVWEVKAPAIIGVKPHVHASDIRVYVQAANRDDAVSRAQEAVRDTDAMVVGWEQVECALYVHQCPVP